jgi:hypothetical protein
VAPVVDLPVEPAPKPTSAFDRLLQQPQSQKPVEPVLDLPVAPLSPKPSTAFDRLLQQSDPQQSAVEPAVHPPTDLPTVPVAGPISAFDRLLQQPGDSSKSVEPHHQQQPVNQGSPKPTSAFDRLMQPQVSTGNGKPIETQTLPQEQPTSIGTSINFLPRGTRF